MNDATAKRFNPWPFAVVGFFVLFTTFTVGLVAFSTWHRVDLVTPDYYEQEMRFQEQINRVHRTATLHKDVSIQLEEPTQHLLIILPAANAAQPLKGSVAFYRPSQAVLDRRFPLLLDSTGRQELDMSGFEAGLWRVCVNWTAGQEEFYRDENIVVGHRQTAKP